MTGISVTRATALCALSMGCLPLLAQENAAPGVNTLENVVVTAQRREQNVQDVPLAISAFSEAEMERRQITEALDLVRVVPNLVGHNNTGPGSSNVYFLRGLGNTSSVTTFDPPVGTYVDDVYISRQSANNYALFDVERIEVLRGPQGTLFGRNTTGGAVNVITKKPSQDFATFLEVGTGRFDRFMGRASMDLPVSDTVLTKFSGFYQEHDGFVRSTVTAEKNNGLKSYGGRVAVRVLPTDAITWDVAGEYTSDSQLNLIRNLNAPATNNTGFTQRSGAGSLLDQARRGEGLGSQTDTLFFVSNVGIELDHATLSFITGYREETWEHIIDFLPTGVRGRSGFAIAGVQDTTQLTQEIKAVGTLYDDRLRYTAGLFYIDEDNKTDFQDLAGTTLQIDRIMKNGTQSIAGYLQLDYALTDRLTLTAGGRYTDEEKDIGYVSRMDRGALYDVSTAELIAGGIPVEQGFSEFTPKVGIEYRSSDDWLWYASATNGFKSGGWNGRGAVPHAAVSFLPFGPEKVWSYEGGFKSQFLEDTMRLNATVFWADVADLQLTSGVTNPSGGVIFLTQNTGEGRFRGAEIEWQWLPLNELNIYASLGLMDAAYTSIKPQPQTQVTLASQPVRSPDVTGNLGAIYTIPAPGGNFSVSGDASFTSDHWVAVSNTPASAHVRSRWLYQAQLGYQTDSGQWSASLGCKNCGDEEYITSWFFGPYFGDPRTWELRLSHRFN